MPPKDKPSKKAYAAKKEKSIEDKTFGLKNKNKSKVVQAYVKSVESQGSNRPQDKKAEAMAKLRREEKEKAEAAKKEAALLFRPVVSQPKVPVGVDPKSIVCELFRAGHCDKGKKCKFSHDLNQDKKTQKIDIYTDRRKLEEDTIDKWDDAKLGQVVVAKAEKEKGGNKTTIICKYFLDAIESAQYGWFWECPNGGDKCMYVHALPPGFVLKRKKTDDDDFEEPTPIEEIIEEKRKQLTTHTPVTLETFKAWKTAKKLKKEQDRKIAEEKRLADIKAGKTTMSGREMFVFNPDVFVDDEAAGDIDYTQRDEDDEAAPRDAFFAPSQQAEASNEGDKLAVEVNQSLFLADDENIPDEDDE